MDFVPRLDLSEDDGMVRIWREIGGVGTARSDCAEIDHSRLL